jgi:hypothetical protein
MIRNVCKDILSGMIIVALSACQQQGVVTSGTDASLFWKKDSVQVSEIVSEKADQYQTVGHHGPAIENEYFCLRL